MKILNWNVNSVHARLPRIQQVIERHKPDIVCFQETKTRDEMFPFDIFKSYGYESYVFGQKSYNGVAILSKSPAERVIRGFEDDVDDAHARFICAFWEKLVVGCGYIPNGKDLETPQYEYKLLWLDRLIKFIHREELLTKPFVLVGDFNIAPEDIDVYDPKVWKNRIHFSDPEKEKIKQLKGLGLSDVFRTLYPNEKQFSWWDYRGISFPKNLGLRIDLAFASPSLMPRVAGCFMDRNERKGEKPSDHIPVMVELRD